MSEQDRLADASRLRDALVGTGAMVDEDDIASLDWLIGEVERLDYLLLVARRDIGRLREQEELAKELGGLLPKKQLTIDRLRGLLARLEWIEYGGLMGCPACFRRELAGHTDDCWLAAELGRTPSEAGP